MNYDEEFRKRAIPLFELNVANYPQSPNAHVNLGSAHAKLGNTDNARKSFQDALQLDAKNEAAKIGLEKLPGRKD